MKILHTADIHLGIETYGRLDPETGLNSRLLDFKQAFDFMVERALAERIDLFLFCGDAYRTADPTPTQQKLFAECLRPIADAGIPIVMIVGNHDHPVSFGKASSIDIFGFLTGEVHLFRRPDLKRIETKSGPVQILALPWPIRSMLLSREEHRRKSPTELRELIEQLYVDFIGRAVEEIDPSLPAVIAAHLTVAGAEMGGSERTSLIQHDPTFTVGQLAHPKIDYVALGHIHRFQDRNPGALPPVVYSSSIERINFKEMHDRKGFVLVEINSDGGRKETRYAFVDTPALRFLSVDVDARGETDPTGRILEAIGREEIAGAVVRVRYQTDEEQLHLVDLRRIRAALAPASTVAAVERVADPVERERRTIVTRESDLEDALGQYIAQHKTLTSLKDDLLAAARDLEGELEGRGG